MSGHGTCRTKMGGADIASTIHEPLEARCIAWLFWWCDVLHEAVLLVSGRQIVTEEGVNPKVSSTIFL